MSVDKVTLRVSLAILCVSFLVCYYLLSSPKLSCSIIITGESISIYNCDLQSHVLAELRQLHQTNICAS